MVAQSAGARSGRGVPGADQESDAGVGAVAGAVWRLHAVAAGAAGQRDGSRECNQPPTGVLEEVAGGDAGRADAAHGSATTCGDELSRGNGAAGAGRGAAWGIANSG